MRLDIITERSQTAEVRWLESSGHTCLGVTTLGDREYKIKLVRGRFGGSISIYPRYVTLDEFNEGKSMSAALPLPDDLLPFIGSTFTLEGAPGGALQAQSQAIELLDEIPEGGEGISWRDALYRNLGKAETMGIFAALGFELQDDQFEDWAELVARRDAEREATS